MANKKITQLTDLPSPAGADILPIVDDVAGTPTTKKVTATNLMTLAPVQSVAGQTGTVTLSNTDISGLGTAATQNVGTSNGNVVQLDATGLPAVNGSQLTNLPSVVSSGTAASLPSSPSVGDIYLETDTGQLRWWDGTYWNTFIEDSQYDPNFAANQLSYSGGLFTSSNYNISTQPIMHFDATFLDGADHNNNPSTGTAVSTWGDRSGQATNYDATQGTASAQPTFTISGSDKYVSFDGGDSLDFTDYTIPTAFNMVVVCNTNSDADTLLPVGTNTNSQYVLLEYLGTTYGIGSSVVDSTYGPHYNSIQQFWTTRDGSNSHQIYVQGGNSIVTKSTTASRTLSRIGVDNAAAIFHTGRIYEIIIWGADLSTTDKNTVNSYLANKYSSLPTLTAFS